MSAPFVPIDRDSAALGTLIDQRQVAGLPLDGRNFLELALLAPGTAPAPQGSAELGARRFRLQRQRRPRGCERLPARRRLQHGPEARHLRRAPAGRRASTSSGSRPRPTTHRSAATPPGRSTWSRAPARIASPARPTSSSGTARSTTRNAFAPRGRAGARLQPPPVRRFDWRADRRQTALFFFADYESTRLREGMTRVTNVPTLAERQGDFSQSLFARRSIRSRASRFPAAASLVRPEPDRAGHRRALSAAEPQHAVRQLRGLADRHRRRGSVRRAGRPRVRRRRARWTARYSFSDRRLLEPFAGAGFSSVPGFGNEVDRRGQNLSLAYSRPRSGSALVNDVRFGYNRVAIGVFPENPQIDNASVGLTALPPIRATPA